MTLYDCECSSVKAQYNEIIAPDILISSGAVESVFLQIQSKLLPTVVSPGIQTSTTHTQDAFFCFSSACVDAHTHRKHRNRAWLPSGAEASSAESDYLSFRRVAMSEEKPNPHKTNNLTECCFLARGPKGVLHA